MLNRLLLSILVFFWFGHVFGSTPTSSSQKSGVARTGGVEAIAGFLRRNLPEGKVQCVLDAYTSMVGVDTYQSDYIESTNSGLSRYLRQQLEENPCFAQTAIEFYDRIQGIDQTRGKPVRSAYGRASDSKLAESGRPSLSMVAGQGPYSDLAPGWVWKEALAVANQNPNLAMLLIGVCGQDDFSLRYRFKTQPAVAEKSKSLAVARRQQQLSDLNEKAGKTFGQERTYINQLRETLQVSLAEYRNRLESGIANIECPSYGSAYFAPRSLGPEADISDELKTATGRVQAPVRQTDALPAKYYHVYAGALFGCQTKQCGVSTETSVFLQKGLAGLYRASRNCYDVRAALESRRMLEEVFDVNFDDTQGVRKILTSEIPRKFNSSTDCHKWRLSQSDSMWIDPGFKFCNAMKSFSESFSGGDQAIKAQKIDEWLKGIDTAILYRQWYMGGGSVLGLNLPCTDIRLAGPENIAEQDITLNRPDHLRIPLTGTSCNIPGWSVERCKSARAELAVWDNGYEWTRAQHEVGAKFGSTQCRENRPQTRPDNILCPSRSSSDRSNSASGIR